MIRSAYFREDIEAVVDYCDGEDGNLPIHIIIHDQDNCNE